MVHLAKAYCNARNFSQQKRSIDPPLELVKRCISRYNFSMTLWRASELALLLREELSPPVLDIGCGDGTFAHLLGLEGAIHGCDISLAALKKAQQGRCPYRSLWRANVETIPAKNESFRTVIANCMLEHVSSLSKTLSEINRILQPGGMLYITVPTPELHNSLLGAKGFSCAHFYSLSRKYQSFFNKALRHYHIKDQQGWECELRGYGFSTMHTVNYLPIRSVWLFEALLPFRLFTLIRTKYCKKDFLLPRKCLASLAAPFLHAFLSTPSDKGAGLMVKAQKI